MLTRGGVYLNIEDSDYFFVVDDFTFYFTSEFNRDRFIRDYKKNRENLNISLKKRFKQSFNSNNLSDIRTYRNIEKRGFHVVKAGEQLCQENLEYDILIKTNQS